MKSLKTISILFILFASTHIKIMAQVAVDSNLIKLTAMNFDSYLTKPIDSFIAKIPTGYIEMRIIPTGRASHAGWMVIKYPNNIDLILYIRGYQYMNPEDPAKVWNISLFRKEKLFAVKMFCTQGNNKSAVLD